MPVAVATGVLIDADHATHVLHPADRGNARYMFRLLHAWEYSFVGLVLYWAVWDHPLLLAAILGHLSHLTLDQITNTVRPLAYFIVFRASHGFKRRELSPRPFEKRYGAHEGTVPIWGRAEPTLWWLYSRFRRRQG